MSDVVHSKKIMSQLTTIFRDVFDDDSLLIAEETKSEDINDWDSLANIRLISSIEKYFKIQFSASEIQNLSDVGDLLKLIQKKYCND